MMMKQRYLLAIAISEIGMGHRISESESEIQHMQDVYRDFEMEMDGDMYLSQLDEQYPLFNFDELDKEALKKYPFFHLNPSKKENNKKHENKDEVNKEEDTWEKYRKIIEENNRKKKKKDSKKTENTNENDIGKDKGVGEQPDDQGDNFIIYGLAAVLALLVVAILAKLLCCKKKKTTADLMIPLMQDDGEGSHKSEFDSKLYMWFDLDGANTN